jgi:hypothetical protein
VAERVVALTVAGPQPTASHWTGAAMAKAAGISVSSVQRIWRAHGLRPHLVRLFKLSNDPQFAATLKEIVGLYIRRHERSRRNCFKGTAVSRQISEASNQHDILPDRHGSLCRSPSRWATTCRAWS